MPAGPSRKSLLLALACLCAGGTLAVSADESDAERALRLSEQGEIMRLEALLESVRRDFPGRVIDMELDREQGRWVYELELVDPDGRVWELEFDAATAELLGRETEDSD